MGVVLAQAPPASGFTPTEYALALVVGVLAGVIVALGKHIANQAEARRVSEGALYQQILPLATELKDLVCDVITFMEGRK